MKNKNLGDMLLYGVIAVCSAVTGLATFVCSNRSAEKAAVRRIDELVGISSDEETKAEKNEEDED